MKNLYPIKILIVSCFTAVQGNAQPFTDIASITYQSQLPSDYDESPSSTFDMRSLDIFSAELLYPHALRDSSYLLIGGQYAGYAFRFHSDIAPTEVNSFKIFEGRAGVLYRWKNNKSKTLFLAIPKWSSDKPFLRKAAFQIGFVGLHTHALSDRFALKLGLYYNHEFFGHFFMPLAGIDWRINDRLYLYGTLPGNLQLHRTFSPDVSVSFSYVSPSGSLLLGDDGDYIRIGKPFPPNSVLSIDLHWTVASSAVLKLSAGHTAFRSLGLYRDDNTHYEDGGYADFKDGIILKAALIGRVFNQ